jgi:sodium-dependent phosphate transporter
VLQIAAIFEFGGAMLLGRVVTNTIAGGIADPAVFARQPEVCLNREISYDT